MIALIAMIRRLAPIAGKGAAGAGSLVLVALVAQQLTEYVDKKHAEGLAEINQTKAEVVKLQLKDARSGATLRSIESNVTMIAERVRIMDHRLWEMYRESKKSNPEEYSEHTPLEEAWKSRTKN